MTKFIVAFSQVTRNKYYTMFQFKETFNYIVSILFYDVLTT